MAALEITLSFSGRSADDNIVDLYDVSQALIGFERSFALTTHLVLNDEVITQAPSLDGAQILARPSNRGSWELTAILALAAGTIYKLGTAPKDTPIGHLVRSAYDYVLTQTLGIHVDYEKTLGQQIRVARAEDRNIKLLSQARFDSVVEKCDTAVREMHRPIYKSETANSARLIAKIGDEQTQIGPTLTLETYEYIAYTVRSTDTVELIGQISSYNINTYKGRVYVATYGRPIPFELSENARDRQTVALITRSLDENAQGSNRGGISFIAFENHSRSGRLKSLFIVEVLSDISDPDGL
jgi:hypothetical protein